MNTCDKYNTVVHDNVCGTKCNNICSYPSYGAKCDTIVVKVLLLSSYPIDSAKCIYWLFINPLCLFVAASHKTGLDTRSKAPRPIKVGIKGRGRSGTNRDSNPAGLCCSSVHLVQCEPDEASSFTNPNVCPGTYARLWLELDSKV